MEEFRFFLVEKLNAGYRLFFFLSYQEQLKIFVCMCVVALRLGFRSLAFVLLDHVFYRVNEKAILTFCKISQKLQIEEKL